MSIATGYVTIALMVSGRFIFQYLGWATAAFITPTVLMLFGGAFFAFTLSGSPATASWAVLAGAITQVRTPRDFHAPKGFSSGEVRPTRILRQQWAVMTAYWDADTWLITLARIDS